MTVYDFYELAMDNFYKIDLWDVSKEETIFSGVLGDIDLCKYESWRICSIEWGYDNKVVLNIDAD